MCYSLAPAGGMKVSSGRVSGRGRARHRAGSAEFQKTACKREETDQIKSKKEHERERKIRNDRKTVQNILITDTELNGTAFRTALRFQQNGREIRLEVQFYTVFTRWR